MTQFILLSLPEVDALFPVDPKTGSRMKITSPGHAICPIEKELEDGSTVWVLPEEITTDPKHALTLEALKSDERTPLDLKAQDRKRTIQPEEFKVEPTEPEAPIEAAGEIK